MRIIHICKYYFPYIGGVENICKYLVENMPQHEIGVVCFDEDRHDSVDSVNGHKVWRVGTWFNVGRQAISFNYYSVLKKALSEFKPDLVQFHWANPFPSIFLLWLLPKKTRLVVHWHMDIIRQKFLYPFIKPFEKALLKRADLICVTSPIYVQHSKPLKNFKDKVRIVPNAINEQNLQIQPGDAERVQEIRDSYNGKPIVFFVGRHIHYKGLPYLLEAANHIKNDCAVVIAGSGPMTDKLKALNKSDKVHFIGRIDDDDLRCHLLAASVFAFPSITKNEAFGVALAEAMYMGVPAVTFNITGSGVNWVSVNNETCLEVANADSVQFASAIDRLLSDEELRSRLALAAKERVRNHFTIDKMCMSMQDVYDELNKNA